MRTELAISLLNSEPAVSPFSFLVVTLVLPMLARQTMERIPPDFFQYSRLHVHLLRQLGQPIWSSRSRLPLSLLADFPIDIRDPHIKTKLSANILASLETSGRAFTTLLVVDSRMSLLKGLITAFSTKVRSD